MPVHFSTFPSPALFGKKPKKFGIGDLCGWSSGRWDRPTKVMLLMLKRFLVVEWRKANAQKRAGNLHPLPLPLDTAETRYTREPADNHTPEQAFEKQWALTLLDTVVRDLGVDYEQHGNGRLFEVLKPSLTGSRETQPYAALASALNMSEGAVRVAVHRLRERYRERLKAEVAHTVGCPADVDNELRHLFRVLARSP